MSQNHRRSLLVATDVVGYGQGDDQRHGRNQHTFLMLMDEAAEAAELHRDAWITQPSGDGELAILPPTESEPRVVDDFIRHLDRVLTHHNAPLLTSCRLRLRVAIHVGVVATAANGFAGQSVVQVGRLLDSDQLRAAVDVAAHANLALAVSNEIYRDTIGQGYTTYRPDDFQRVSVAHKEYRATAWIHVPAVHIPGDVIGIASGLVSGNFHDTQLCPTLPSRPGRP